MTESQFIDKNLKDWQNLEALLNSTYKDTDKLNLLFLKVSSDLSYARTYYENRMVRVYLNDLVERVLDLIKARGKKSVWDEMKHFFGHVLPAEIKMSKHQLLLSLFVFIVAISIGAFSASRQPNFTNKILSDDYVQMTENNIEKGDPMAVYKKEGKFSMATRITINNIQVAFMAYLFGIIGGLGSLLILISNGVMVGAFVQFFIGKGLGYEAFSTIFIHGAMELSAIVIAGAAGLILGSAWVKPLTFEHSTALKVNARRSLRLLLSTVPLFLAAGILEGFVTRLTDMTEVFKWIIIIGSFGMVAFIYIIYPFFMWKGDPLDYAVPAMAAQEHIDDDDESITTSALISLKYFWGQHLSFFIKTCLPIIALTGFLLAKFYQGTFEIYNFFTAFSNIDPITVLAAWIITSVLIFRSKLITGPQVSTAKDIFRRLSKVFLHLMPFFVLFLLPPSVAFAFVFLIPLQYVAIALLKMDSINSFSHLIKYSIRESYRGYGTYLLITALLTLFFFLFALSAYSTLAQIVTEIIGWHQIMNNDESAYWFIFTSRVIILSIMVVTFLHFYHFSFIKLINRLTSIDIRKSFFKQVEIEAL